MAEDERLEQIRKDVDDRGIEFFFAQFVDLYARPSAKLIPAAHLDDLVDDGAGFAGFAAGDIGQVPSDPDIAAIPDLASFTPVPWEPTLARFACDVTVEGEPWPYYPRTILRNELARARERGLRVQDRDRARVLPRPPRRTTAGSSSPTRSTTLEKPCYDMGGLTRHYDFLTTVSKLRATSSAGGTTRTTTRTRTGSSSRTSSTTTRSSPATARSSSATWCTRSRSSRG